MKINRRRAPSSQISREKKISGHKQEELYANLIGGIVIKGTQKGDVEDKKGNLHSVKSGKKWQIFLYGYSRINSSIFLKILQPCLEAFPENAERYFEDRVKCINFKENYIKNYGRESAKKLTNGVVDDSLGVNEYVESKKRLSKATDSICAQLKNPLLLRDFFNEALFNNEEVQFLVIKDTTYKKDEIFNVFAKEDILEVLTNKLFPSVSKAGNVPEDYNVSGQKVLFCYQKNNKTDKNIIEIEIRNDSKTHYRQVRFNMYSLDTLFLLINSPQCRNSKHLSKDVIAYGKAVEKLVI